MNSKSETCYASLFNYIEENIITLKCKSFMTDYEIAMRNALQKLHSDVEKNQCWFHYCQALKRNASKIQEFYKLIKTNSIARKTFNKFLALPLLPQNYIIDGFNILLSEINVQNMHNQFLKFTKYFEKQWLKKVTFLKLWC